MNNLFSVENKTIALTGATGVLGSTMAKHLVGEGAKVILLGRSKEKIDALTAELEDIKKGSSTFFILDVMNENDLIKLRDKLIQDKVVLDGLINLAGGNLPGATLKAGQNIFDLSLTDTETVVNLNLMGSVIPSIVLSEIMVKQGFGSIVNISSMAAKQAITRVLGYSMAKSAIDIFTKWMAQEMASKFSDKIRVNAIAPGFFLSNQNLRLLTNEDDSLTERGQKIITGTPMARFGKAEELNGLIQYLLSDASSFVTGSIYDIDGGFSVSSGV